MKDPEVPVPSFASGALGEGGLTLPKAIALALREYPRIRRDEKFAKTSPSWGVIKSIQEAVARTPQVLQSEHLRSSASFGKGVWTGVPIIAFYDARETSRLAAGVYVVYLLRGDGTGVVLSLNQGSADLLFERKARAHAILARRAAYIRGILDKSLATQGFIDAPPDLHDKGVLSQAYTSGSVVSKTYTPEILDDETSFFADFELLMNAYRSVVPSRKFLPRDTPLRINTLRPGG